MLNGLSGFVIFGVTDASKFVGQQVTAQTVEDIVRELRRIEPPAFPEIETITLDSGRTIVALRVPGGGGPSSRVSHDLSPLQQELLEVLAQVGSIPLRQVKASLSAKIPERTVQDNLSMLRRLDLIEVSGIGQGARWRHKQGLGVLNDSYPRRVKACHLRSAYAAA